MATEADGTRIVVRRFSVELPERAVTGLKLELLPNPGIADWQGAQKKNQYGTIVGIHKLGPLAQVSGLQVGDLIEHIDHHPCTTPELPADRSGSIHFRVVRPVTELAATTAGADKGGPAAAGQGNPPFYRFVVSPTEPGDTIRFSMVEEVVKSRPPAKAPPAQNEPMIGIDRLKPQEFQGIRIYRVPMRRFDPAVGDTVYSFEYRVENLREHDQMLSIRFAGDGFLVQLAEGTTLVATKSPEQLEGVLAQRVLPPTFSGTFCLVEPAVGEARPGKYTSEVGVEPWGVAEKFVEEVQGVTLSKTVTQRDGVEIEFSVTNSRDFPIKVKIQVEGVHDATKLSPQLFVGPGSTMGLGSIRTQSKVRVAWSWEADELQKAQLSEFKMEGVVLTRALTASTGGKPGTVSFSVTNPKPYDIQVSVTVMDAENRNLSIREPVKAGADDVSIGPDSADVSGRLQMRWGWKQLK